MHFLPIPKPTITSKAMQIHIQHPKLQPCIITPPSPSSFHMHFNSHALIIIQPSVTPILFHCIIHPHTSLIIHSQALTNKQIIQHMHPSSLPWLSPLIPASQPCTTHAFPPLQDPNHSSIQSCIIHKHIIIHPSFNSHAFTH